MISRPCFDCGEPLHGEDLTAYGRAGLAHVRAAHPELPYPDTAVRNFFEGLVRTTGGVDRLDHIGVVAVHQVDEQRVEDWLALFDFDASAGTPQNSACYCLEPHEVVPGQPLPPFLHWTRRREQMVELLRSGTAVGYLAYVDAKPAGWVNASLRARYGMFRRGDARDDDTIGIACFNIAPPYRKHGLARRLLERVLLDGPSRGAAAVEAYPLNDGVPVGSGFRGSRAMYEQYGFTVVKARQRDTILRRVLRS